MVVEEDNTEKIMEQVETMYETIDVREGKQSSNLSQFNTFCYYLKKIPGE